MDNYTLLQNPFGNNGVFIADGKKGIDVSNPYLIDILSPSEILRLLRDTNNNSSSSNVAPETQTVLEQQSTNTYLEDMNLSFDELLKQEGISIRVTSRIRPKARTKSGHVSHHSHTDLWGHPAAIDIVPTDGNFEKLKSDIYNNQRIVAWLRNHNKGILEETTSDVKSKTGATGDHFHVGPDEWAKRMSSKYISYTQPQQAASGGKMGSKQYPIGGGNKTINPRGSYTLFHTFGYGKDKTTKHSGVDCSKRVINTLIDYMDKGCNTLQDLIMMYHLGMQGTWDLVKSQIRSKGGLRDQGTGRWISAEDWIRAQETYLKHCSDYMHMPLNTRASRSRDFLYPLVTFISRKEQGVNTEAATAIALQEMRIS